MAEASSWERAWRQDGPDWPNRSASRFVQAAGLRWHVQVMGQGPVLLLVHGTGAATHSWRDLAPLLAREFTVVAPDLPGHGFTEVQTGAQLSLPGMAAGLRGLLHALDVAPVMAVGHSAGAAVIVRMSLDRQLDAARLVGLNAALLPFTGLPAKLFRPMAQFVAANSLIPRLFARHTAADASVIGRLIGNTGSSLDPVGVDLYRRLATRPDHVAAAFRMMAHWNLEPLIRELPRLVPPLTLVTGSQDRTIPASQARRVRAVLPSIELLSLPGLGHLAHEEQPAQVAALIVRIARAANLVASVPA